MTKKEYFAEIRAIVADREDLVAFVDHEVELLSKKSKGVRKPSARQVENEAYKADILTALATVDEPQTVKGIMALCEFPEEMTNQRVTHMLTDLRKAGEVKRTYVKKVAYFELGSEVEGD